jgi:hypothetical protein
MIDILEFKIYALVQMASAPVFLTGCPGGIGESDTAAHNALWPLFLLATVDDVHHVLGRCLHFQRVSFTSGVVATTLNNTFAIAHIAPLTLKAIASALWTLDLAFHHFFLIYYAKLGATVFFSLGVGLIPSATIRQGIAGTLDLALPVMRLLRVIAK